MTILSKHLRRDLETAIKQARDIAEAAAAEALARIAVADAEAPTHMTEDNKALRRRLRAHGRALGDTRDATGVMTTARLQDAAAYEIWHRMLFGRFLVERGLLIHPDLGATLSLAELRDLAQEEGAADEWALAEQYAAPGLPGVFKPDDPVLLLPIAPEFSKRMRAVLSGLPPKVFAADDSLGWTYQSWRASEKDTVNTAGGKIGAVELPAVTQLFTEPYMVKFLLHNTLGAWWAGKVLAGDPTLSHNAANEDALRTACALPGVDWEFLRFVREDDGAGSWRPAAGAFPGWPIHAAEITYCDPCCGSGHFLVESFAILSALRQREEGLSAGDAAVSVLRDNLHGLELDGRCVQIAAFNVALAAWKLAGSPIPLPSPHIAWVGAPPPMSRVEMAALANGDSGLRRAMETLHDQFVRAPLLGSLLEVGARDLLDADLRTRSDLALAKLREAEPEQAEGALAARGLLDAYALLTRRFVLLATNVPFLGRAKQDPELASYIANTMPEAKTDLATAMLQRMCSLTSLGGSIASVTPQNWLFLGNYRAFRKKILSDYTLSTIIDLGPAAFEDMNWWAARTALVALMRSRPARDQLYMAIDADTGRDLASKPFRLTHGTLNPILQSDQNRNPDGRIMVNVAERGTLLGAIALSGKGSTTGDSPKYHRFFWELLNLHQNHVRWLDSPSEGDPWSGRSLILRRRIDDPELKAENGCRIHGQDVWGKFGVVVNKMGNLEAFFYDGEVFDDNINPIVALQTELQPAIWMFCSSDEYSKSIRKIDQALKVTNSTLVKVPFNLSYWQTAASERYPDGLPEPYSDDPTQWLFHGHPAFAKSGTELHVALCRLAGYRWPAETDATMRLSDLAKERIVLAASLPAGDADGILPLNANGTALALADRLRASLTAAFGAPLSPTREQALVRSADAKFEKRDARDTSLETWLSDRAFRQHCTLFQQRPFLWQVWDGMKDGFSAFLHYHRLDRAALDKLTYTLLGHWIATSRDEGNTARVERAERLKQSLAKIIEGENPFDIFVRWKSPAQQPIGWEPELDDGVRLNIRPFMTAGVLREQPKGISWNKDRGTDVLSAPWYELSPKSGGKQGDRINDHHLTLARKRAARGMP